MHWKVSTAVHCSNYFHTVDTPSGHDHLPLKSDNTSRIPKSVICPIYCDILVILLTFMPWYQLTYSHHCFPYISCCTNEENFLLTFFTGWSFSLLSWPSCFDWVVIYSCMKGYQQSKEVSTSLTIFRSLPWRRSEGLIRYPWHDEPQEHLQARLLIVTCIHLFTAHGIIM